MQCILVDFKSQDTAIAQNALHLPKPR